MYEDQTYDIILERMMNRVSDKIDKRPSSPVYDLHSSTAIEFQILYIELEYLIKNSYGDTAAREFLILLAKDRGLSPEPATKAILQGEFTPTNIDVTGKRFNIDEINYVVTEQITPGTYKVQCETEGVVGNQYLGDMIPMEYIDGLQTASLTSVLFPVKMKKIQKFSDSVILTVSMNSPLVVIMLITWQRSKVLKVLGHVRSSVFGMVTLDPLTDRQYSGQELV